MPGHAPAHEESCLGFHNPSHVAIGPLNSVLVHVHGRVGNVLSVLRFVPTGEHRSSGI